MTRGAGAWGLVAFTVAIFVALFSTRGAGAIDFWWWMAANNVAAVALAAAVDRGFLPAIRDDLRSGLPRKVAIGLAAAAFLYAVFWVGNELSRHVLPAAGDGIERVYGFKEGASLPRIVLLMALVIGPGEELVWRAFLQRFLVSRFGPLLGLAGATATYAAVHVGTGNAMLVLAALVCGAFWGALYLRLRSIVVTAVSHTVWDLLVFVAIPFA